jgi:hypothetical protein
MSCVVQVERVIQHHLALNSPKSEKRDSKEQKVKQAKLANQDSGVNQVYGIVIDVLERVMLQTIADAHISSVSC